MSDIFNNLDERQLKAVKSLHGPNLVVAGPGSGKTRVLTVKAANLILNGVDPSSIVLFTFTNKAAKEIAERVRTAVGPKAYDITIGTYHSVCRRTLKLYAEKLGYKSRFTVIDTDEQKKILTRICKDSGITVKTVIQYISEQKKNLKSPQIALVEARGIDEKKAQFYEAYQTTLKKQNAMDYDDLIFNMVKLLQDFSSVKEAINEKYRYIIADEFHDSSPLDITLIDLLAGESKNLTLIEDPDQCLSEDTTISLPNGTKKSIKEIQVGDNILVAGGKSKICIAPVASISKKAFKGDLYKVTTKTGRIIKATANHIFFARFMPNLSEDSLNLYYVYLMYKKGKGYRIGRTSTLRSNGSRNQNGFEIRLNQETGDKIWVLESCNTLQDAIYYEAYYSYQYGIPQYVFLNRNAKGLMSQEKINEFYSIIDTKSRAEQLLKDKDMFLQYPHYVPQASSARNRDAYGNRNKINFIMFGGSEANGLNMTKHRLNASTTNLPYKSLLEKYGSVSSPTATKTNTTYYSFTKVLQNYDDLWRIGHSIYDEALSKDWNMAINHEARLLDDGENFKFTPTSHLKPGIEICINEQTLQSDIIISIEKESYDGYVYDLNVDDFRNYIANDIVVHNCIYSFRGSSIKASMDYANSLNPATFYLDQNYRSSGTIVEAAKTLIEHNEKLADKNPFSCKAIGDKIIVYEGKTQKEEATRIVQFINLVHGDEYKVPYNEIAILYRTTACTKAIEEALILAGIPYHITNGCPFMSRMEIKDILSFIRLAYNSYDYEAYERAIQIPKRGIGTSTIQKIYNYAVDNDLDLIEASLEFETSKKSKQALKAFAEFILTLKNQYLYSNTADCINYILDQTKYYDTLSKDENAEARIENIQKFHEICSEYPNIAEMLEMCAFYTDVEENPEMDKVNLMTLHVSKGLEYDCVFICNFNEGSLPHVRCVTPKEIEEERRLCFVGITRSRKFLFLTRPKMLINGHQKQYPKASRFLEEINSKYLFVTK